MVFQNFDVHQLSAMLPFRPLIEYFESALAEPSVAPVRTRLEGVEDREMLVMPVLTQRYSGVKILNVVPDNPNIGRPVIDGLFVLFDAENGCSLAAMDASELTARRTAAVSALASSKLSRADSKSLLVIGSGHLAPYLAEAHATVRPIDKICVWARDFEKADACRAEIEKRIGNRVKAESIYDLAEGVQTSDIVSAATRTQDPLIKGEWLNPGVHIDLVGGYRPDMREIDDAGIRKCRIFVDSKESALAEAGDIISPLQRAVISQESIEGELTDLLHGAGRNTESELTLFKSVGIAAADLAAASFAFLFSEGGATWEKARQLL